MDTQYTPIEWAEALAKKQTPPEAHRIANTYRQPLLGKDNDVKNPMAAWYERAYQWLLKNHPLPPTD